MLILNDPHTIAGKTLTHWLVLHKTDKQSSYIFFFCFVKALCRADPTGAGDIMQIYSEH